MVLALGVTGAARSQEADWASRPGQEVSESYPALALAMRVEGRVLLRCMIDDAGVVVSCLAQSEEPKGLGFGDAAEKISSSFRFKPGVGENAGNHEVRIPIKFALPHAKRSMPEIGRPTSAEALTLAREYLELEGLAADWTKGRTDDFQKLATKVMPGVDQPTRSEGLSAVLAAGEAAQPKGLDLWARVFASHLTADQLRAVSAYDQSDGGRRLRASRWQTDERVREVVRRLPQIVSVAAHDDFCAHWDCALPAETATAPEPAWVEQPTGLQLAFAIPPLARGLFVSGRADLHCAVSNVGLLEDCSVRNEWPKGMGYGVAALAASKYYRAPLKPDLSSLDFTLRLNAPLRRAPTPQPTPDKAMVTARQIVTVERTVDQVLASLQAELAGLDSNAAVGMSTEAQTVAKRAVRAGALTFAQALIDARARAYVEVLSPSELETRLTFVQSPEYQALAAMLLDQRRTFSAIGEALYDQASEDAGTAFCRARECPKVSGDAPPKP